MLIFKKLLFVKFFIVAVVAVLMFSPVVASAAPLSLKLNCYEEQNCDLDDFEQLIVVAANYILGISGSVTLLFFIYGGVVLLTSGGAQERVTQGRTILVNSVIGLVIIFTSYMIISFTIGALKGGTPSNLKVLDPPAPKATPKEVL